MKTQFLKECQKRIWLLGFKLMLSVMFFKAGTKIIYSTAKETRKLATFKLFEYLICFILEFWFTHEANWNSLTMTSRYSLSSTAGTIQFWKVSGSDRIISGFHILCLTCLIKGQWIWNLPKKDVKSFVCDGRCVFPIHSHCPNRKSAKLRNMTKINAASDTPKPFIWTWKL